MRSVLAPTLVICAHYVGIPTVNVKKRAKKKKVTPGHVSATIQVRVLFVAKFVHVAKPYIITIAYSFQKITKQSQNKIYAHLEGPKAPHNCSKFRQLENSKKPF